MTTRLKKFPALLLLLYGLAVPAFAGEAPLVRQGFFMPDSLSEFTLRYHSIDNLIILPVRINGGEPLNLILDTGCRNIVLFGKRFMNTFTVSPNRVIEFSGMGSGKNVKGFVSLNNQVQLGLIEGEQVPLVVVPENNLFRRSLHIDGLIGYDIFTRFEIELIPNKQQMTFRPASTNFIPPGYTKVPIEVVDSRPMVKTVIDFQDRKEDWSMLIDTGSALGLLIKVKGENRGTPTVLGKGLNGLIEGMQENTRTVAFAGMTFDNLKAGLIQSPWHHYASVGMAVLKDYALILNYAQSYACLKKL